MPSVLSKSRILSARQCPKRLWLEVNNPSLAEQSGTSRAILGTGVSIGELARKVLAPGGVLIEGPAAQAAEKTSLLLGTPNATLHEATFGASQVYVRSDLLWQQDGQLSVAEVKSASKVKPYHIEDCAIQYWVLREAGYPPTTFSLAHINTRFVLSSDGSAADAGTSDETDQLRYKGLFTLSDITPGISALQTEVPKWIRYADNILASDKPNITTGPQCKKPHACPFISHCQAGEPQVTYPIAQYPGLKPKTRTQLFESGFKDIRDVPATEASSVLELQDPAALARWQAACQGKEWLSEALLPTLRNLPFPRYFLDFESIAFAVPIWPGSKPFEQFPFQFSAHVQTGNDSVLEHREFLDLSGAPPLRMLAESLIKALDTSGPVVVYTSFERTCINGLARRLPDLAEPLQAINARLFDLYAVLKKHYYHPAQNGSYSIKKILPVVLEPGDADYSSLHGVSDGLAAQLAYTDAIALAEDSEEKQRLKTELLDYCGLDTLALYKVMQRLLLPRLDNR